MTPEDLIALNEEIAGMARAGLPLDKGLAALAAEMGRGKLRTVTAAIAEDLSAGRTLPEALERQRGRVPPFYAGLVSAGVRTGRVSEVLATLTVYARSVANVRRTVVDSLFYPAIVLAFAGGLAAVFMYFILPQFDAIFSSFNMKLPYLTELVIQFGRHPLAYFVMPIAVVVGGFFALRFVLGSTERGRQLWARLLYGIPVVGTLIRSARLAAFTDLLAILVDHDTPLPEAFRLAGAASSDPITTAATKQIHFDLTQGIPLGQALRSGGLVPEWVSWMAGLGERRGALGQTLHQVSDMYRRQVEMRAALLQSLLPPFLVIGTAGLAIGMFLVAMFLPLVKLLEGLSK